MSIKFRWLGYVCFEMVLPSGKVLVIDPYIDYSPTSPIQCNDVTGADYIAITHGHYDHVTDVGSLAKKFNSKVICSYQVAEPLAQFFDLDPHRIIRVTAGNSLVFEDLTIEVKKSEHISLLPVLRTAYRRLTGEEAAPDISLTQLRERVANLSDASEADSSGTQMRNKLVTAGVVGGEQLNFVFQTSDNLRLYIYSAGPDEYLRHEVLQAHPNVFFVQLGGVTAEAAAGVAALSGADIVIPTHHDGEGIDVMHRRAQELAQHLAKTSKARLLDVDHGTWYEIGVEVSTL